MAIDDDQPRPFTPLHLLSLQSIVVDLQAESPGWVPRMRSALGREGEVTSVDRAPGGQGVRVRMDGSGDQWHFHPGALASIIPREVSASSGGSPVVSRGSPQRPPAAAAYPPPPTMAAPPTTTTTSGSSRGGGGGSSSSKAPPPPSTILANGLIELEPLWAAPGRKTLLLYGKPSYKEASEACVSASTRVQVVDLR